MVEGGLRKTGEVVPAQFSTHPQGKVLRQLEQIGISLSQGRQLHHIKTQPIEKIPAKLPAVSQCRQVDVGRTHQTNIHLQGLLTPDTLKLSVFNYTQQLFLQAQ